jgi:diguanylate cyclase (GGDEF)-like protein/PAS domain S-box-containing protein
VRVSSGTSAGSGVRAHGSGWASARPFAVATLIAIALLPVAGASVAWGDAALSVGLLAAVGTAALTMGSRAKRHADVVAILSLACFALLRDSAGGAASGYGVLALVPVLAVAMHGTRAQLARTLVGVAAMVALPLLLIGAPHYPPAGWRAAVLLLLVSGGVGVIVQELLARERRGAIRLERLLRAMGDGVIVSDPTGLVLEVNDALCALTGFAAHELLGRRAPLPSWPEEDHELLMRTHAEAVAAGGGEFQARLVRKDGTDVFVLITLAVFPDADGRRTIVATVKDVGQQVALLAQLREERDRSAAILASMQEGFALTRDGHIVEVNPALCEITGFPREQLIGEGMPYPYWAPESAQVLDELRAEIVAAREGLTYESQFMRVDGRRFPAEVTTTPLYDADDQLTGFLNTIRDISDRKRAEQTMLDRNRELAALADVTRAVAHADPDEARTTICEIALQISGATAATVWEADAGGVLHNTCALGTPAPAFALGPESDALAVRTTFRESRALFIADALDSPLIDPRMKQQLGNPSVHFQPIVSERRSIGVLGLSWPEPLEQLDPERAHMIELLAHEASVAIARAAAHAELARLARTDALTGLANRRALEELLAREVATSRRTGRPFTVAMIDLDHFKAYNDAFGHPAGDRLLRSCASAWTGRLRETDVLARWGGEEFCLLLPGCRTDEALEVLAALRALVPEGQSFSAGVAESAPGADWADLVAFADQALYAAKRLGRARSVPARALAA